MIDAETQIIRPIIVMEVEVSEFVRDGIDLKTSLRIWENPQKEEALTDTQTRMEIMNQITVVGQLVPNRPSIDTRKERSFDLVERNDLSLTRKSR